MQSCSCVLSFAEQTFRHAQEYAYLTFPGSKKPVASLLSPYCYVIEPAYTEAMCNFGWAYTGRFGRPDQATPLKIEDCFHQEVVQLIVNGWQVCYHLIMEFKMLTY